MPFDRSDWPAGTTVKESRLPMRSGTVLPEPPGYGSDMNVYVQFEDGERVRYDPRFLLQTMPEEATR